MKWTFFAFFVGLFVLAAGSAAAQEASEAREHFRRATAHFAVGEFAEAADEYQAAYKLKQDAALLYDAAQSYRLAGNHKRAVILYKNYLNLYPHAKNAASVRAQIEKLETALAADQSAKTSPPTGTDEPSHSPPVESTASPALQPSPPPAPTIELTKQSPPDESPTPVYKKWWLWTAVAVVVAAGATTAIVLATRPADPWANSPTISNQSLSQSRAMVRW